MAARRPMTRTTTARLLMASRKRATRVESRVLVTQQIPDEGLALLRQEAGVTLEVNPAPGAIWSPEELRAHLPGHDYVLCLLTDQMDAAMLEAGARGTPALRLVANMAVGFNNIDVEAARRLGI